MLTEFIKVQEFILSCFVGLQNAYQRCMIGWTETYLDKGRSSSDQTYGSKTCQVTQ
jgi:hypothetical protein